MSEKCEPFGKYWLNKTFKESVTKRSLKDYFEFRNINYKIKDRLSDIQKNIDADYDLGVFNKSKKVFLDNIVKLYQFEKIPFIGLGADSIIRIEWHNYKEYKIISVAFFDNGNIKVYGIKE